MKHRVALIGCGRISFKHLEGFVKNIDMMELVGTCDPKVERAEKAADDYARLSGAARPQVYGDFRVLLRELKIDFVTIATESGYHRDIAVAALDLGISVVCEKPMALSTDDADAMIAAARRSGSKLAVCFQNRFNAPIEKTRAALDAGRFGKLLHGMVQIRWNRNEAYYAEAPWRGTWDLDGGTLMNQCTHGIDLLQWLMGEDAVRVQAVTRRYLRPIEAEDFGAAIVEFASGAVGIIEGSADIYPKNLNESLSLFGTQGSVVIGGLAVNRLETWRFADSERWGDSEEKVLNPSEKDPPTVYGFGHNALFADFSAALREGREPRVNGEKGKKALEIILAIYQSQKEKRAVDLPSRFSTSDMAGEFDR